MRVRTGGGVVGVGWEDVVVVRGGLVGDDGAVVLEDVRGGDGLLG